MAESEVASISVDARNKASSARSRAPVFVMGCHRSGTNLLYDTLLSAGGFAVYRGYLPVYKSLIPRFGALNRRKNRENLLQAWLQSESFRRSGLPSSYVQEKVLNECSNGGDFIRITMNELARQQQVVRWAVYDPDAVLYLRQIKSEIPDALFIHMIRDGRDVALSLKKMGGFRPFPWNRRQLGLEETAIYWKWMAQHGRECGCEIPADYTEVHYEELISEPKAVLSNLSPFLDHDLNYEHIQQTALGRISESNSSFRDERQENGLPPVNRWKKALTPEQTASIESAVGEALEQFGYKPSGTGLPNQRSLANSQKRFFYPVFLDAKLFLKTKTPLGRFSSLALLHGSSTERECPAERQAD